MTLFIPQAFPDVCLLPGLGWAVDTDMKLMHSPEAGVGVPEHFRPLERKLLNKLLMPSGLEFWILPGVTRGNI